MSKYTLSDIYKAIANNSDINDEVKEMMLDSIADIVFNFVPPDDEEEYE